MPDCGHILADRDRGTHPFTTPRSLGPAPGSSNSALLWHPTSHAERTGDLLLSCHKFLHDGRPRLLWVLWGWQNGSMQGYSKYTHTYKHTTSPIAFWGTLTTISEALDSMMPVSIMDKPQKYMAKYRRDGEQEERRCSAHAGPGNAGPR